MKAATPPAAWLSSRRNAAPTLLFAVAVAISVAVGVYYRGGFRSIGGTDGGNGFRQGVVNAVAAVGDTVAGLFDSRSPGEREDGTFANMKQRKHSALHQRALPKVRRGSVAAIVSASPMPPGPAPLYNAVTSTPKAAIPGQPPGLMSTPGGPGGFPGLTPLPGGGGIIVPSPAISPPETPTTPAIPTTTTPVPEPASWLMMLLGFAFIGNLLRAERRQLLPLIL